MTESMAAMLDLSDQTLHRCGGTHLVTACGIPLPGDVTVGPFVILHERAARLCSDCWPDR